VLLMMVLGLNGVVTWIANRSGGGGSGGTGAIGRIRGASIRALGFDPQPED
jgi:hypothetical protein